MKNCKICGELKPLESFHKHKKTKDGRQGHCKECHYAKCKKSRKENPEKHLAYQRARTVAQYGLTIEDYQQLLKSQRHRCAICGLHEDDHGKALVVDHNHKTGEVRGLLCRNCNVGIGVLGDSVDNLISAASYLKERGTYDTHDT